MEELWPSPWCQDLDVVAVPCGTRLGVEERILGWTFGTPVVNEPTPRRLGLCWRSLLTNTPTGWYERERRKTTRDWWSGRAQNQHSENKGDAHWREATRIIGTSWGSCWKSVRVYVFGKYQQWNWQNWRGNNGQVKESAIYILDAYACVEGKCIRLQTKLRIFNANVESALLCGSETWISTKLRINILQTLINKCLTKILNIRWPMVISNENYVKGYNKGV